MKRRLLFAVLAIVSALSVSAWDGSGGKVYLQNVGTGLWWGAGNNWGTQASLLLHPEYVILHSDYDWYLLESQVDNNLPNGGGDCYFNGSYMDNGNPVELTITQVETDVYTISNGSTYYGYDGSSIHDVKGCILASTTGELSNNYYWRIFTEDEMMTKLNNATEDYPVDATFLILDPSFGRNNVNVGSWTMEADNQNLSGGNNINNCAESWRSAFTLSQTISLPNGIYEVTAQAAMEDYSGAGNNLPVVYANGGTTTFKTKSDGENSMSTMSESFTNGKYQIDPIRVVVTNGKLTIGVRGTRSDTWCIWDNFQLKYFGNDLSALRNALQTQIDAVAELEGTTTTAAYNYAKTFADVIDVNNLKTEASISALSEELSDRVEAAKALQSAYAQYKVYKTAVEALDDDATIYTGNATIDISDIGTAVESSTTLSDLNDAIDAALQQFQAVASEFLNTVMVNEGKRFDITNIYLTNPDFEKSTANGQLPSGWNITITGDNCGQQNRTDTNPESGLSITNFIEAWHPSQLGNGVIAQTVSSLPEGTYILECDASICHDPAGADDITGANLFVQSTLKKETVSISNVRLYINHYSVQFVHDGNGQVSFGLEAINTNANWLSADNFKVYYAGGISYASVLADVVAEFYALEATANAAYYSTYKAIVDDLNKSYSSKEEYQSAIASVKSAIALVQELIEAETAYNTALNAANAAKNNEANANVTGNELTALNNAIAAVPETTVAGYTNAAATLNNATTVFVEAVDSYNLYATSAASGEIAAAKAEADGISEEIYAGLSLAPLSDASDALSRATTDAYDIRTASYNYVTSNYTLPINLGTWTTQNAGDMTSQHWDGTNTSSYNEQAENLYSSSTIWTTSYSQTITLPAGEYVFKVAGRHSASSTLILKVANGNTTLGTVSDFPTTDKGRGINIKGETDFSDAGTYANGTGRGWQWRYVPFVLNEETSVTISVIGANLEGLQNQWVSFCNYTVQAKPTLATSIAAYNQVKAAAEVVLNSETYANIQGTDRSDFIAVINTDKGETIESIDAAAAAIQSAQNAFIATAVSWDNLAYARSIASDVLPYANPAKKTILDNAIAVAVTGNAADAQAQADAINQANRRYVESNAMAEGVEGAINKTSLIANAALDGKDEGSDIEDWGIICNNSGDEAGLMHYHDYFRYTDGDGIAHSYIDQNGMTQVQAYQVISNLPAGRYLLTATARARSGVVYYLYNFNCDEEVSYTAVTAIGDQGGVFGNGWNDVSLVFEQPIQGNAEIGIQAVNESAFWLSMGRFRLVRIGDANTLESVVPESVYANNNATRTIYSLGRNLMKNGSFEYDNALQGWKAEGYASEAQAENFTLHDKGGVNDGTYITTAGAGNNSVKTLCKSVEVESGETYYFCVYTSGKAPAAKNFKYNALFAMSDATNESSLLKEFEWPQGAENTTSEWSKTEFIFTATTPYVGVRMGWNEAASFDNFVLTKLTPSRTEGNVDYALDAIPTENVGNSAFQYSQSTINETGVYGLVQGTSTVQQVQDAYNALNSITLNVPDEEQAYNLVFNCAGHTYTGNALTLVPNPAQPQGLYGLQYKAPANVNLAQAFYFTHTTGNKYKIHAIDMEGNERYITTQAKGYGSTWYEGIRTIADAEKAMEIEIRPNGEGLYILWNTGADKAIAHNGNNNMDLFTNNTADFQLLETTKPSIAINTTATGWGTVMFPFAVDVLPEGVKAYTCAEVNNNAKKVIVSEVDALEANKPYIIEGTWEETLSGDAQGTALTYTEGLLTGVYTATAAPVGSYVMQKLDDKVAFYIVGENQPTVRANHAYLTVPEGSDVKAFYFDENNATGIGGITVNGTDGAIYNLAGQRVSKAVKGVFIVNGRKVVKK